MRLKHRTITALVLTVLFIVFLICVKTINVAEVGPQGTKIGFSAMNQAIHEGIGVHLGWYKFTEILGILVILSAGLVAGLGVLEWISRKSILKVDPEILTLGLLYGALILLYLFFELVVVNYRPIIMPGENEVEASFPSTHTMLAVGVMGSIVLVSKKYISNQMVLRGVQAGCILIILLVVIGRLISGVHWFTDIIAGILLGTALLAWYPVLLQKVKKCVKSLRRRKRASA